VKTQATGLARRRDLEYRHDPFQVSHTASRVSGKSTVRMHSPCARMDSRLWPSSTAWSVASYGRLQKSCGLSARVLEGRLRVEHAERLADHPHELVEPNVLHTHAGPITTAESSVLACSMV
jgi:hypothetical protein